MGWERRGNGMYYYRKRWQNGRVRSEYIGNGPVAELFAEMDDLDRMERAADKEYEQLVREEILELDRLCDEAVRMVRDLIAATLLVSGFHRHRGQWRRTGEQRE